MNSASEPATSGLPPIPRSSRRTTCWRGGGFAMPAAARPGTRPEAARSAHAGAVWLSRSWRPFSYSGGVAAAEYAELSPENRIAVTVDRALCIGSGDCVDTAPDVFQLDDETGVVVDPDGALSGRDRGSRKLPGQRDIPSPARTATCIPDAAGATAPAWSPSGRSRSRSHARTVPTMPSVRAPRW